ncbi:uncharacterized protein LOC135396757 [Ornithodoros turicata]|uniref:uncharacterized protein LOC135396757 n=1 Tax=Ornithodoros turicata TaxID=34597 RepID=UPI0031389B8D
MQQTHIEQLLRILENLSSRNGATELPMSDFIDEPFKTIEDFVAFEEELKRSSEKRKQLRLYMKYVGGTNVGERTMRILSRLLSSVVGKEFSLHGAKGKRKFNDLQMWKLMCGCLAPETAEKARNEGTLKEVEKAAQSWLRHAPESYRKQQARENIENEDHL